MSTVVEKFGQFVGRKIPEDPASARQWILRAYRVFGWYQDHFPDKKKPPSRQYLASACMHFMIAGYSHMDQAALVSIFMPCELLQAFDLHPICAEMYSTYLNGAGSEHPFIEAAEAAGVPETYCSYHKVVMGAALNGVMAAPGCILNTSLACDANNLTFRTLAQIFGRPQYYLDVPYTKNETSVDYVAAQLKEIQAALEEHLGRKMDPARLQAAVQRSAATIENVRATLPYRRTRAFATDLTSELYEGLMVHNMLGTPEALEYSRLLLQDYQNAPAAPENSIRLLWMHSNPFWQASVRELFNFRPDQQILATELGYDNWQVFDPADPYRYMASRLVYNPYNGPVQDRIAAAAEMAQQTGADGVVLFCHWGCKETCGASALIKKELEARGFPTLVLNGDGVDRMNAGDGQMLTRLEAFLEMLKK